jgi:hypothetical protein
MQKDTVIFVTDMIKRDLVSNQRRGVQLDPLHQVLIALRFYCTGNFQLSNSDHYNVSQGTVSNVVKRLSRAIAKLNSRFIRFPSNVEAPRIRQKFFEIGGFPGRI